MHWNWLLSMIYGLISGFSGFLPVSVEAHQRLFQEFTGVDSCLGGFVISCRLGALAALVVLCRSSIHRLHRENRIARIPTKRRRRQPDKLALNELRFLRTALAPAVIVTLLFSFLSRYVQSLWMLALMIALCGVMLYIPQYFRTGNKSAATVSALDAILIGASLGISPVTGLSGMAGGLSIASVRGLEKRFALELCLLLCIPVSIVLVGIDIFALTLAPSLISGMWFLLYFLAAAAAFVGAYFSVQLMRFLSVRLGFSGFSYYCWALALFTFALYLMI